MDAARHPAGSLRPPRRKRKITKQDYPSAVHPLHRYAAPVAAPEPEYHQPDHQPSYADAGQEPDPSRYDDALYGQLDPGAQHIQHDPAYPDDRLRLSGRLRRRAEEPARKRGGGMITVAVVLALAVVGTGAAFAYRTFVGSPRSGEPPIIKADNSPTKIVPAPADGSAKVPDRMATGDGAEKIVPREEAPVDVNARSGPRVVFPPLNQNGNPPSAASVAPAAPAGRRRQRHAAEQRAAQDQDLSPSSGDQADGRRRRSTRRRRPSRYLRRKRLRRLRQHLLRPRPPRAVRRHRPMRAPTRRCRWRRRPVTPAPPSPARVAAANRSPAAPSNGGGYLVQVCLAEERGDAQASYRALQGKYPAVLGSRSPVIKRADLGEKGVYYRAMIGPFGSAGRGHAVLRQPENCRRAVRRPKELTAVSLTLGLSGG